MSRATKHARHDAERRQHRKEVRSNALAAAKRPKEHVALWFLAVGLVAMLILVVAASAIR
ncbi:hypothetical protein [Urbifossiella limnaea]|uniref:Uncharacterized protein n=1 Tax=Urbifossiella limnaea TaxID=2528023 RepID=A0A517XVW0_9BACT|nr:hypothetical protein [Urbifossiella limnaea]QDU21629.1 hypothetical protein ETAA1_36000 [Urbifossiella limnaea]